MGKKPPSLHLVTATQPGQQPPRTLGESGTALWRSVVEEYTFEDSAGCEMLLLACEASDRVASMRKQINADGECIRVKGGGLKDHPLLRHEAVARAFVVKTLKALNLDIEPLRPGPGRPPNRGV